MLSVLQANDLYKGRIALIGESAHVLHPVAGQGFNVSVRDIAVLAGLIHRQKSLGLDIGSQTLLDDYSQWRKFDITQLVIVTDKLISILSTSNLLINTVQDLGFKAVNAMSFIRHFLMKDAMGLTGDLPELLQPPKQQELHENIHA